MSKGRTIRKVMEGGGGFSVCRNFFFFFFFFFFAQCLCRNFFFSVDTLCTNFFFLLLLLLFSRKKTLNKGFLKKVVLCGLGMITFNP